MAILKFKNKKYVNTLLNIDTVFGEYEGRVLPIIITLVLAAVPLLGWLFLLQGTPVKLWYVIVFDLFWSAHWALKILGKEKQKMEFYEGSIENQYAQADELVHVAHIHEDGLIEYQNGVIAYIISGFPKGYLTDDKFSVDIEAFMDELDMWNWDLYLHTAIDEVLCEDNLPNLGKYLDKQVINERMEFYSYQDEWSRSNCDLYRVSFFVSAAKYNWKKLKAHLEELVSSELALCFNEIEILDRAGVNEITSRDLCAFVNLEKMLTSKYDNEQYHGSKVLWYDDEIPNSLKIDVEESGLDERRVN